MHDEVTLSRQLQIWKGRSAAGNQRADSVQIISACRVYCTWPLQTCCRPAKIGQQLATRQKVRRAIMAGQVCAAQDILHQSHPDMLESVTHPNLDVLIFFHCLHYIELIRLSVFSNGISVLHLSSGICWPSFYTNDCAACCWIMLTFVWNCVWVAQSACMCMNKPCVSIEVTLTKLCGTSSLHCWHLWQSLRALQVGRCGAWSTRDIVVYCRYHDLTVLACCGSSSTPCTCGTLTPWAIIFSNAKPAIRHST